MSPYTPSKPETVKQMFSSISNTYDSLNRLLSLRLDHGWRRNVVELASLPPQGMVLDLCTGTGDLAFAFAKQHKGAAIFGLDFSPEMLRIARKKAQCRFPDQNILFLEGDALHIPFLENTFDCITIAFGLRNVEDLSKLMGEMVRVLKKGGRAIALELTRPQNVLLKALYKPYLNLFLPMVGRFVSHNKTAYRYLSDTIGNFYEREEVLAIMAEQGFRDTQAIPLTGGAATLFIGSK